MQEPPKRDHECVFRAMTWHSSCLARPTERAHPAGANIDDGLCLDSTRDTEHRCGSGEPFALWGRSSSRGQHSQSWLVEAVLKGESVPLLRCEEEDAWRYQRKMVELVR